MAGESGVEEAEKERYMHNLMDWCREVERLVERAEQGIVF